MPYVHIKKLCNQIIIEGLQRLSMSMGIVSHIENDMYEIVAVHSAGNVFVAGESFPLQDSYCREVYETGKTVALTALSGKAGLCKHPLYSGLPLEAYISAPIYQYDQVWGTLNFSSMKISSDPFTEEDIKYIEFEAGKIAKAL